MPIDLKEDVVSLTDFARNTKQHAKELALGGRARFLTQNGKASVVVLSLDAYEKMAHDAEEYRTSSGGEMDPARPAEKRVSHFSFYLPRF